MHSPPVGQAKSGQSFARHLLWSHMSVAVIGAFSLLLALLTIYMQTRDVQRLSGEAIPISRASSVVLGGVQQSLASMRGWVSLKDDSFVHDWYQVWDDSITPAASELGQLGMVMELPGFSKRMTELTLLLAELKESQWWVIEIAQTPGNEPAKVVHQFKSDPILITLDKILHTLLNAEKGNFSSTLQNAERNSLHDAGIYYYAARETLQKIIFRGEVGLEDQYFYNLDRLKTATAELSQIVSIDERIKSLLQQFTRELTALQRVSSESIVVRKSNTWNVARHLMKTETVPLAKKIVKVMNHMSRDTEELMTRQAKTAASTGKYATIGLSIFLVIMVFAAGIFSRKRAADLSRPVIALAAAANKMATGSLSEDISQMGDDELGALTRSFNTMRRELQETQQKMVHQEKLAAIGQLSGSVAHDIRNPLGAITNSIYFLHLISNEKTDERIKEHLTVMEHEINRANGIINDLLDFSKENVPTFVVGDLNDFLHQMLSVFDFYGEMSFDLQLESDLPLIAFDHSLLQRVLSNLIINGRQAMPDGGTLHIHTSHDDEFVQIEIRDSGHGITEENLPKIFEPLFTTRASGVGLGLSIVKDLVEKHHGSIEVESVVDKGTSFVVQLPIQQDSAGSV